MLLEVKGLVTEFRSRGGTVRAVDNLSFTLSKGETLGIVGESGSGKSVTALSLMRLVPQPAGRIIGGEMIYSSKSRGVVDLRRLSEPEMRTCRGNEIAMIFQEPMTSLNPVYTCGAQVAEAVVLHQKLPRQEARARTIRLFEQVRLPRPDTLFDTYPHQISGGQKQRVMIAMALSCRPNILIADEPTTALDVTVQRAILDLMKEVQQAYEMGIVFITHDLGVVAELADRVLVMYRGRVVEQGSVRRVMTQPEHPYTRGLLACRPPMDRRLHWLPTVSDFMTAGPDDSVRQGGETVEQVLLKLVVTRDERENRHRQLYAREPLLSIRRLKTYFQVRKGLFGRATDCVRAVDDVSFDVFPGETLGLVGESGCGKTTLGRTILRLVEPTDGEIIFRNRSVRDLSGDELRSLRKEIQIVFQDPYSSLNPRKRVGDAIVEPMRAHDIGLNDGERKERAIELLRRVNLDASCFYRYPHEFSGGERQRLCVARALAVNPRCLICDEPVSALDVSVQAQVLNLLHELRAQFDFTYIFISHDLSVVRFMSDRMVVMNRGRIEEIGEADEICSNPRTDYARTLIGAIPRGQVGARGRQGIPPSR